MVAGTNSFSGERWAEQAYFTDENPHLWQWWPGDRHYSLDPVKLTGKYRTSSKTPLNPGDRISRDGLYWYGPYEFTLTKGTP